MKLRRKSGGAIRDGHSCMASKSSWFQSAGELIGRDRHFSSASALLRLRAMA